jgi:hypothetical protein
MGLEKVEIAPVPIQHAIFDVWGRASLMYFISVTNKMIRYTMFFITVNALHVSGGFSAHHQELKTVHTASGICQACLAYTLALLLPSPKK